LIVAGETRLSSMERGQERVEIWEKAASGIKLRKDTLLHVSSTNSQLVAHYSPTLISRNLRTRPGFAPQGGGGPGSRRVKAGAGIEIRSPHSRRRSDVPEG
jgi:hypothetical protein